MMAVQSRQTKVLVALLASIIAGALVLNALGYNPPSAGAFCLSRYYRLEPVEKTIISQAAQYRARWKRIEIFYSDSGSQEQTKDAAREGVGQLDSANSVPVAQDVDCHFVICNGQAGYDGQIRATEKWQRQSSVSRPSYDGTRPAVQDAKTIFICIVTNGKTAYPTDFQIKRSEALVEELCRRFDIQPASVLYPNTSR